MKRQPNSIGVFRASNCLRSSTIKPLSNVSIIQETKTWSTGVKLMILLTVPLKCVAVKMLSLPWLEIRVTLSRSLNEHNSVKKQKNYMTRVVKPWKKLEIYSLLSAWTNTLPSVSSRLKTRSLPHKFMLSLVDSVRQRNVTSKWMTSDRQLNTMPRRHSLQTHLTVMKGWKTGKGYCSVCTSTRISSNNKRDSLISRSISL
jgi:hypothetical protein